MPFPTQPFGSSLRPDWGDLSGLRPSQTEGLTRRKQLAGDVQAIHAADRAFAALKDDGSVTEDCWEGLIGDI